MSNAVAGGAENHSREAGPAAFASAGATLRKAREQAGLHIGALAVSLKVPVKKLEALEADQLDQLPDAVFARALASSVCRALKLDPGPVLQMLPEQATPRLAVDKSIGSGSFDRPGMGWRVPLLSRLPRLVLISAGVLLLAALALLLLPSLETMGSMGTPAPVAAVKVEPAAPAPATANMPPAPVAAVAALPAAPADVPMPAAPAVDVGARAQVPETGGASASGTDPATAASGLVVFTARGPSWVEVADASGSVQLRKTLAAGETASASGAAPLSVVVGRADVTDVVVRGSAFDLAPVTRDNVARFQIK